MKQVLTIAQAKALLDMPVGNLTGDQLQSLRDFREVLLERSAKATSTTGGAIQISKAMNNKTAQSNNALAHLIKFKLACAGDVIDGFNASLPDIALIAEPQIMRDAENLSLQEKEIRAYRQVARKYPYVLVGRYFQQAYADLSEDERLELWLELDIGHRVPKPPSPEAQAVCAAWRLSLQKARETYLCQGYADYTGIPETPPGTGHSG